MSGPRTATAWNLPRLAEAPLPAPFFCIVVEGRPRRPAQYPTQAAAMRAARDLGYYERGRIVSIYRCEAVAALRDEEP